MTRCVCADVLFTELLDLHRSEGLDFDQLVERTGVTRGCAQCAKYIRRTLATGEVAHPVMPRVTVRSH